MQTDRPTTFTRVAYTHFVPCLFAGFVTLYLGHTVWPGQGMAMLAENILSPRSALVGACNGIAVTLIAVAYHFVRYRNRGGRRTQETATPFWITGCVAFTIGSLGVLLGLHNSGILLLTAIVLGILVLHLRTFSRHMVNMLKPGNLATWSDVSEFMRIYMTMLAGFTLINATMEGIHLMAGSTPPFGFNQVGGDIFLNSLYYTVVTMTTLGFGDIVPKTWDGKLLLIFQCLVSYFMFALVIGIVTRGVVRGDDRQGRKSSQVS